jgi:hypothetical protein
MGARLEPFPSGGRDVGVVEGSPGSCFNCPITQVAMNDPVVLVESGFTNEARSSAGCEITTQVKLLRPKI